MSKTKFLIFISFLSIINLSNAASAAVITGVRGGTEMACDRLTYEGFDPVLKRHNIIESLQEVNQNCTKTFLIMDSTEPVGDDNKLKITVLNTSNDDWLDYHFEALGNFGMEIVGPVVADSFNSCEVTDSRNLDCKDGFLAPEVRAVFTFTLRIPNDTGLNEVKVLNTATNPSVPEPASSLSLLALGTLGAASTFKRQLKPSKSTEKETTKIS